MRSLGPELAHAYRLVNGIDPGNTRSIALATRLGFQAVPNLYPGDAAPIWVLENRAVEDV